MCYPHVIPLVLPEYTSTFGGRPDCLSLSDTDHVVVDYESSNCRENIDENDAFVCLLWRLDGGRSPANLHRSSGALVAGEHV